MIKQFFQSIKPQFFRLKAPRQDVADNEYQASGFIPYKAFWDEKTIITSRDELMQFIKVSGFSFETADDEDLNIKKELRNMLFKGMSTNGVSMYFTMVRRKQTAYPEDYASVDMPDGFAFYLDQKWATKHKLKKAFINELYITVIKKPSSSGILSGVEDLIKNIIRGADKGAWFAMMKEAYDDLQDAVGRVMNSLRDYSPVLLGIKERPDGTYSEISEFLYTILNCGERSNVRASSLPLAKQLVNHRMYFGSRSIELKRHDGTSKFAGMVSIKEYGPRTWPGMMDGFLQMPFEFVMTQSWQFIDRQAAIMSMQLQQDRMRQAGDKGISQTEQITKAVDQAMSGDIGFGKHHMTVMCMADSMKELENVLSMTAVELTNTGGIGVRETVNMEPAYWGQLPGNFDFLVRQATVNTQNLAGFNSLHNFPVGSATDNHWGDAVTVLDTTSGTPYYFNFHVRDVGHTTIIGPTGAGKTVLMNFLCAQAQKYKCRLFFFDKDRGAEIFIRALGGQYSIIDPSKVCGFNPLQLSDTGENRNFLVEWLKILVTTHEDNLSSDDIDVISRAVAGNYKLAKKDRKLSNIAPFFGIGGPGTLAGRLMMWYGSGSHANIFDNDVDVIDFGKSSVFGFEMAELLKDKSALNPVLSYVFHRIGLSLDGTPTMLVLDEAWALIDNPVFAPKIKDWLKVLRKLNTFVVFATQSVEDATKSSISDTLIQQTATQIFLPNLKATSVYRTTFMLSERELQLIKTMDPSSRFFLIKQGNDSVIARVDLSGMSDIISILSGRASTVLILDEVRKQYGDDPNVWIPIFHKKVQEAAES